MVKGLSDIMQQARELQDKLASAQAELEVMEIEGEGGGGLVRVVLTGRGVMRAVKIDPSLLVPGEREVLEDLIVAAHNDAKTKMDRAAADKMRDMTGGLPLPPGFNLGA